MDPKSHGWSHIGKLTRDFSLKRGSMVSNVYLQFKSFELKCDLFCVNNDFKNQFFCTLVNVYVDLVVFTRIAGTS